MVWPWSNMHSLGYTSPLLKHRHYAVLAVFPLRSLTNVVGGDVHLGGFFIHHIKIHMSERSQTFGGLRLLHLIVVFVNRRILKAPDSEPGRRVTEAASLRVGGTWAAKLLPSIAFDLRREPTAGNRHHYYELKIHT
jgi:hypothetical protein